MLHITNGDATVSIMRQAGITGDILPWRDLLHEGPVPADLALADMSKVRARFIADGGLAGHDEALAGFRERDAKLAAFRNHDEVILWFEHDLYDQLQILQLLDYFADRDLGNTTLNMICVDEYLGLVSPERVTELHAMKQPVTAEQLRLGKNAWSAFCAPDPAGWNALNGEDTSALPFLAGAVVRHMEQYPSIENGLNRTEAQLLNAVHAGIRNPGRIFEAAQAAEERRFMGDSTFWIYLNEMLESRPPLLKMSSGGPFRFPPAYPYPEEFRRQEILPAEAGIKVLQNELDWVAINSIDKWLGGVHLTPDRVWRWDGRQRQLVKDIA